MYNIDRSLSNVMSDLEYAVSKLGGRINSAGVLWNDEKFFELKSSVSSLARETSFLLSKGRECCSAIEDFERIVREGEYGRR